MKTALKNSLLFVQYTFSQSILAGLCLLKCPVQTDLLLTDLEHRNKMPAIRL